MRVQKSVMRVQPNAKRAKAPPCGSAPRRAADVLLLAGRWQLLKAGKSLTWWATGRLGLRPTVLHPENTFWTLHNANSQEEILEQAMNRSAKDVLDDHLRESQVGSIGADLARNYAEDLVVLTRHGVYRGHDGLRQLAEMLRQELPDAVFEYHTRLVEGEIGFLEWTGRGGEGQVDDGADSYLIRDGKIVAQTIHYTVNRSATQ
jgi:hypothetical protein